MHQHRQSLFVQHVILVAMANKEGQQTCLTCRTASPHSLAHAACVCYEQDGDFQYSGADAQTAGPVKRRLNYLSPDTSTDRHIPLSVQKYMHGASGMLLLGCYPSFQLCIVQLVRLAFRHMSLAVSCATCVQQSYLVCNPDGNMPCCSLYSVA